MRELSASWIAAAIGASEPGAADTGGPTRAVVDSREAGPGDLFFGLAGERDHGSKHAPAALAAGAWGAVVERAHFEQAVSAATDDQTVFAVDEAQAALTALATYWRKQLDALVVGVTGSTGKTTTKDILAAMAATTRSVVATPGNLNTEIGLPLVLLGAPAGTEVIVLEMAMRGKGQIAELTRIARPDVGCIVNVGPVHLEQLGTVEAVAAAKAELFADLAAGCGAVLPFAERLLTPHLRAELRTLTFGPGGDVRLSGHDQDEYEIAMPSGSVSVRARLGAPYLSENLLAAAACCELAGIAVGGELRVDFSQMRGEVVEVLGGVTIINDCYNANPISLRAALDRLALASGRRVAVLGGMAELGEDSPRYHRELGEHALEVGVQSLVTVGELARGFTSSFTGTHRHVDTPDEAARELADLVEPGDTVLVKGSRSLGLEAVTEALADASVEGAR